MRITREDLYREVWSEPATKLARRYEISSSYLARVCEALDVPHPPRGYWARKAAGEKIAVPPLPTAAPGDPLSWEKGAALLERLPPLVTASTPSTRKGKSARSQRPSHHPLVTAWRSYMEEATANEGGYMVPRKRNVLDAFVTRATIRGAANALDSILIELEMRGHRVQLSADYSHRRPPVEVTQAPIRDQYARRPNDWQPGRPTLAYVKGVVIGLTLFELTEHVRVRRTGSDRYVRISDLPAIRRYAPQSPDEEDLTRDMPTGRCVLRAYSPLHDTEWRHEWTETHREKFTAMATTVADLLEEAVPVLAKHAEDAERRERERQAQAKEERRRRQARERVEAQQRARQAAKDDLRSIVTLWNEAFALEAFFNELSRRAASLEDDERAELEARICAARELLGGQAAVDRFLRWRVPADASADEDDDIDDEDD